MRTNMVNDHASRREAAAQRLTVILLGFLGVSYRKWPICASFPPKFLLTSRDACCKVFPVYTLTLCNVLYGSPTT